MTLPFYHPPARPRIVAALIWALSILLSTALAPRAHAQDEAAPPNILVFFIDDMGLMDSSVPFLVDEAGAPQPHPLNAFYRTPSMERLAAQGLRFSQFYANSVCSPSRISLMTGQTSARHRTTQFIKPESNNAGTYGPPDWRWEGIAEGEATLASLLREAGYRTLHIGKGHFGPNEAPASDPTRIGFDVNIAGCAYGQPGSYYGQENFGHGKKGRVNRAVPGLEKYHGQEIFLSEALTRETKDAITKAVSEDKPFFAYLSHYAVHSPFQSDPRFAAHYAASGKPKNAQAFATLIEGIDQSLGDLLDHLVELEVANNTLVFFLGDNGTDAPLGPSHEVACSAPLRGKKATHYEGGMRVPFIAAWAQPDPDHPGQQRLPIQPGILHREFGTIYDLHPTILEAAGLGVPDGIDGRSLWPYLAGTPGTHREQVFLMHFPHKHRSSYVTAFRHGDWKLVYHYRPAKGQDPIELFNLAKAPAEPHNLASEHPSEVNELIAKMAAALEEADAQYVRDDEGQPIKPVTSRD